MEYSKLSDQQLLENYLAGNELDAGEFYRRYARRIYLFAASRNLQPADAEDATQRTFISFFKDLKREPPSFDVSRDPMPWLRTIARRKVINFFRQSSKQVASDLKRVDQQEVVSEQVSGGTPIDSLIEREDESDSRATLARVKEAINSLPQFERDLLFQRFFDPDFSYSGFCRLFNLPETNQQTRSLRRIVHRRMVELRELLAEKKFS